MGDDGEMLAILRGVRNTRHFAADPVSEETLAAILEVARRTGSAMNAQPWEFVVVRDPATIRAIAATGPNLPWLAGAPLAIVLVMDGKRPELEGFDEGRLAERIMAAAYAQGLAAGLGWLMGSDARQQVRTLLGVPEGKSVRTVVAVGYSVAPSVPAAPPHEPNADRKPLAELVHHDRYAGARG